MNSVTASSTSPNAALNDLSGSDKHCVFRSGASWFSLPAIVVREISIAPDLVRVPHCHQSFAGVCHLRSEFIPVIMLNTLLNIDKLPSAQPHNKLMVINGTNVWSLLIAEAATIESLETIVTPDTRMDDATHSAVMGTAMSRDQIVHVLDPNGLFRIAQQALDDFWAVQNQPNQQSRSGNGGRR